MAERARDDLGERGGLRVEREQVGLHNEAQTIRRDRIRWGPIWAGVVAAIGAYLFLQLALVALGIVELGGEVGDDAFASAIAALVAFFIGGVVTGMTTMWQGVDDGIIHGVIMWFAGLLALLVLSTVASGLALGAFDIQGTFENVLAGEGIGDDAQEAAGWALLGLSLALAASAGGGAVGSKLWPKDDVVVEVARVRPES